MYLFTQANVPLGLHVPQFGNPALKCKKPTSFNLKRSGHFWVWTFLGWCHEWMGSRDF